jgi:hypothetical protein
MRRIDEIADKWIHSRIDYTDTKWLIERVRKLETALEVYAYSNLGIEAKDPEKFGDIARKALEKNE